MIYRFFQNIDFAYPQVFLFLLLIPLMVWWYAKNHSRRSASIRVSTVNAFNTTTWKNMLQHLPFVLRLLAVTSLVMALARPQQRNDEELTRGEGIDIVLSMDVSGSMLSTDFLPNRMEVAKEVASEFVSSRPIDRIGLVIFAGESFTQTPITTDRSALLSQIDGLRSGLLKDGTHIGEGLATAVDRLSQSDAQSKVVILLTDGKEQATESRLIDPFTALEIAKAKGVKAYTIGMSSAGYVAIQENVAGASPPPAGDQFLDEDLLRKIANETGGQYFRATDKDNLKAIYNEIDKLEKSRIEVSSLRRFNEKFLPFVLAALVFLFAEILLRSTILKKFP